MTSNVKVKEKFCQNHGHPGPIGSKHSAVFLDNLCLFPSFPCLFSSGYLSLLYVHCFIAVEAHQEEFTLRSLYLQFPAMECSSARYPHD